jgi:hypothetical protein
MEISSFYQGQPIYIKFPKAQTSYQGYISYQSDYSQKQTITGSFWPESQEPDTLVSFFTWEGNQYWIYSIVQPSVPPSGTDSWFVGYWGNVATPTPNGGLKGTVCALSNETTGNVAHPWLNMKGPYSGNNVTILFPLLPENPASYYDGYIMFHQNAVDIKSLLIDGSYWRTPGGTGSFFSFFTWQGITYWIFGQCYDL